VPTYLVTGGAGFIGSNLVRALLERGGQVRVLDDLSTGRAANLADLRDQLELIEADLRDQWVVKRALQGVEAVFHQGALPSVARSVADPLASHEVNASGTLGLLLAASEAGVRRFVFASSSSVYGDTPTLPKSEDLPTDPLSPYAVSKLAAERYCRVFHRLYGLETVCLRYFNVFGPRQDPASEYSAVIPKFITTMLRGESPVVHGDGSQSRDFSYIANVVQANLLAAEAPGVGGEVFNIACGERASLLDLVAGLNQILGTSIEPTFTAARPGDVKHSLADISRAERLLGYQPLVRFQQGLALTVDWYRGQAADPGFEG
jgi:UDP-N-acetylglucosamine/UDP-N-acetyl-alpha-D-glucosaminouronate 4-epimerase